MGNSVMYFFSYFAGLFFQGSGLCMCVNDRGSENIFLNETIIIFIMVVYIN